VPYTYLFIFLQVAPRWKVVLFCVGLTVSSVLKIQTFEKILAQKASFQKNSKHQQAISNKWQANAHLKM